MYNCVQLRLDNCSKKTLCWKNICPLNFFLYSCQKSVSKLYLLKFLCVTMSLKKMFLLIGKGKTLPKWWSSDLAQWRGRKSQSGLPRFYHFLKCQHAIPGGSISWFPSVVFSLQGSNIFFQMYSQGFVLFIIL